MVATLVNEGIYSKTESIVKTLGKRGYFYPIVQGSVCRLSLLERVERLLLTLLAGIIREGHYERWSVVQTG